MSNNPLLQSLQSSREEFEKEKGLFAQLILGALEYRGFYDAGKYLDNTIIEAIEPRLNALRDASHKSLLKAVVAMVEKRLKSVDTTETPQNLRNHGYNACLRDITKDITLAIEGTEQH